MKNLLKIAFSMALVLVSLSQAEAQKKNKKKKAATETHTVMPETVVSPTDTKTLIARKWSLDGEYLKAENKKEADKIRATNPEKATEMDQQAEMMISLAPSITLDFKTDGTVEIASMGQTSKGTWRLEDNGKALVMKQDTPEGKEDISKIIEISAKVFRMQATDGSTIPLIAAK